jgi:3-phenylpropionate/cinnamic acid dioxygenase small subunit
MTTFADVAEGVRGATAAYAQALDDGRTDDVVALFCADGGCDIPGLGAHEGSDALRLAYARVVPYIPQRHLVVNTHVTGWSENEATAMSDFVLLVQRNGSWRVAVVGRYHDVLHHDGGAWRFHRRTASFEGAA